MFGLDISIGKTISIANHSGEQKFPILSQKIRTIVVIDSFVEVQKVLVDSVPLGSQVLFAEVGADSLSQIADRRGVRGGYTAN